MAISSEELMYERVLTNTNSSGAGSYKLWYAYLIERLQLVRNLPINSLQYETLNNTFERALVTMHKMPRIWILYLQSLTKQKLIARTRRTFDRALCALPVTQHERIWEHYLSFVGQKGVPIETSLRVYRRYLMYDPSHVEDLIEFLIAAEKWQEGAEMLAQVLNDDGFFSIKGKSKHRLWLELCDLLTKHATEVEGSNVDAIIRGGIRKFTGEVGCLWTSLADYYIRRRLLGKVRDVFEEGLMTVVTVRDFSVIFDAYLQFEESMLGLKMENMDVDEEEMREGEDDDEDVRWDVELSVSKFEKKILKCFWLHDDNDVDMRLARLEYLMDRRPELANSVLLRQNPHNVEQWHRRVKLFEGNLIRQILTYTEAVRTVDPMKAVGKPHTIWVSFAKLYETHSDLGNARVIFDKAVQVNFKAVDHLASVWCEWAEMELRHKNFKGALDLMRRATAEKAQKSLKLWTFYVDLEETLGNLNSARDVYEQIIDLRMATPQLIINYAMLLEEHKYFEDSFRVYERGVKMFKYPHVKYIWVTYLSKFVKRYKSSKLERARELFDIAVETAPAECVKQLFLQYAKLEENYGLAKRAMNVYDKATKAVPPNEKLSMYEIYIARAAEIFGVPQTRDIYELAISSGLPDKDVKTMCMKYAELEKSLGDIDRSRAIYTYASQFADPRRDLDFWSKWNEFEVQHGNEDAFREMLCIRRTVAASFSQTHFILPDHLKQNTEKINKGEDGEAAMDEMTDLEKQLAPPEKDGVSVVDKSRSVGFVSAGHESQQRVIEKKNVVNQEEIKLPEESDDEDEEQVEIAQKDVPSAVFGRLAKKRDEPERGEDGEEGKGAETRLGALERMKRRKTA